MRVERRTSIILVIMLVLAGIALGLYAIMRPRGAFDDVKGRLGIEPSAPASTSSR